MKLIRVKRCDVGFTFTGKNTQSAIGTVQCSKKAVPGMFDYEVYVNGKMLDLSEGKYLVSHSKWAGLHFSKKDAEKVAAFFKVYPENRVEIKKVEFED